MSVVKGVYRYLSGVTSHNKTSGPCRRKSPVHRSHNFMVARDPRGIPKGCSSAKSGISLEYPPSSTPRGVYSMGRWEIRQQLADQEISMKKLLCVVMWVLPVMLFAESPFNGTWK